MRSAIQTKYSLIRYYYTQLSLMSQGDGVSAFYKPLFFEFPDDPNAYRDQQRNVMLGQAMKLSVLSNELGVNEAEFYFPMGTWCDIFKSTVPCFNVEQGGLKKKLSAKPGDYHVHLRGGHIVPLQNAMVHKPRTSSNLQNEPVDLHLHAKSSEDDDGKKLWKAHGRYLNDDGISLNTHNKQNKYELTFNWDNLNASISIKQTDQASSYK